MDTVRSTPTFRYHPDPVATGSAVPSEAQCVICREARGFVYDGPVYGKVPEALCLTCIATGAAAEALAVAGEAAEFTDVGFGVPDDVSQHVLVEISQRTPGFRGWQQEHWLYHCGDAAAFLGLAGDDDVREHPDALEMLLHENDEFGWSPEQSEEYVKHLRTDGDATAYLFRCLACGVHMAYTDMS